MSTQNNKLNEIHSSLVNGQRRQMVAQIKEYGLYDFWADYQDYLTYLYVERGACYTYFSDAVISYHRITNR